jgi:NTE family protein
VDTSGVNSTDFRISEQEKSNLYSKGVAAAQDFLSTWDFEVWKQKYGSPSTKLTPAG